MDRESALTLVKGFYFFNAPPLAFMEAIVRTYLMEKGYEMSKIDDTIRYLLSALLLYDIAKAIIEHYEREFNICKLWSAPNPLNNQGQDIKIILVF